MTDTRNLAEWTKDYLAHSETVSAPLEEDWETVWASRSNFVLQSVAAADLGGENRSAWLIRYEAADCGDDEVRIERSAEIRDSVLGVFIEVFGSKVEDELFYQILQNMRRKFQVKGVMVRGTGADIWLRISRQAVESGMTLAKLGEIVIGRLREEFPEIFSVRISFLTEDTPLFQELSALSHAWADEQEQLKARVWEARGYNFKDCHILGHCGKCADKNMCANIRKMERTIEIKRKA
jgi:hypothetical protein